MCLLSNFTYNYKYGQYIVDVNILLFKYSDENTHCCKNSKVYVFNVLILNNRKKKQLQKMKHYNIEFNIWHILANYTEFIYI